MKINRNNYETIFLLYVDKELTEQEMAEVEAFVEANPDLGLELRMLQEAVLQPELDQLPGLKESLLKFSSPVNESNYEEYFVRYGDNELSREEKEFTEQFVYRNPRYQAEFELILEAHLVPDNTVVFPDKQLLFRSEKDERRVIPFNWRRIAAAAVLLLFVGSTTWMLTRSSSTDNITGPVAKNKVRVNDKQPSGTQPVVVSEDQPALTESAEPKENGTSLAVVNSKQELASKKSEKKSVEASNKKELPIVEDNNSALAMNIEEKTPQAATVKADLTKAGDIQVMDRAVSESELQLASLETSTPVEQSEVLEETDNSNVVYIANTTVNKKGKFRGIVRKASRFLERTASIDPSGNERGVRIANLEIALK